MTSLPEPDRNGDPPREQPDVRARFPDLYRELRGIAAAILRARPRPSVGATDLTHEAFTKLAQEEARRRLGQRSELGAKPDPLFKGCFAAACRDVLAEHWRRGNAQKRGGEAQREELITDIVADPALGLEGIELNADLEAVLEQLGELDPFLARLVEQRVFGGLTLDECATNLESSLRTVERKWSFARVWLQDKLG